MEAWPIHFASYTSGASHTLLIWRLTSEHIPYLAVCSLFTIPQTQLLEPASERLKKKNPEWVPAHRFSTALRNIETTRWKESRLYETNWVASVAHYTQSRSRFGVLANTCSVKINLSAFVFWIVVVCGGGFLLSFGFVFVFLEKLERVSGFLKQKFLCLAL